MTSTDAQVLERLLIAVLVSFVYISIIAKSIGTENKERWFKRRTRSSFFTRRGFVGDYINFGRPVTWQGYLVMVLIYGVIFSCGYWYLFV